MEDFITRCNKKFGKRSKCGHIAVVKITRTWTDGKIDYVRCRCANHSSGMKNSPQNEADGINIEPIVHDWAKVNAVLEPLVGKIIYSKWHRRELIVKYIKRESMILMCQDARFDETSTNKHHAKWQAVYAKEITNVI